MALKLSQNKDIEEVSKTPNIILHNSSTLMPENAEVHDTPNSVPGKGGVSPNVETENTLVDVETTDLPTEMSRKKYIYLESFQSHSELHDSNNVSLQTIYDPQNPTAITIRRIGDSVTSDHNIIHHL